MTTEYSACVIVGLPYIECNFDYTEYDGVLYIADYSNGAIVGLIVDRTGSFSYNEVDLDALDLACQEAKKEFKKLTGQEGKVFLSLDSF